jgi:hypothetical protein
LSVSEDEFIIGVTGDVPDTLVNDLVVVVTQTNKVVSCGEATP